AKEPTQRYASVEALREDLARYLAGRPVLAWRGTAAYRVSRFARRRVTAMGMAAFAALVLAAIAVVARPAPPGGAMPTSGAAPSDRPLRLDPTAIPAVARGLYEEGFRAYHQQDMHSARRLFRAALAEDSSLAVAAYYTLTIELGMGLPPDSGLEARLRRLVKRLPEPEGLLVRGRIASGTLDPALLAVAETLTTRYPSEAEGHLLLGRALLTRGDLLRALPRLRRVVAMDSLGLRGRTADCHACDALAAIVSAYIHADSLPAAERTARDWVRAQPTSGQACHHLALALELQGEREEALAAIRRAAPLKPGNPYVPIYPALLDIRLGSFEAADRLLREQVRAGPPSVQTEALWFLTISLRYQGRVREALATARALRRLRPDMSEPRMAEAQVLFEMGRPREAAALFDSLAAEPGRGELGRVPSAVAMRRSWHLTHAADARTVAGDTAGLWPLADTIEALGAQTLSGQRRRLHPHVRGLRHAARGDTAQAVREFYRATFRPIAPSSGFTRTDLELARGLLALGRPEEAVRALQPALRGSLEAAAFYLTYTELHALLGRAFEATGQADSARAHYRRVLDAWKDADPAFHARRDTVRLRLAALGR
ncbi:MAG TPA: tetratricopeptide repeat protein, partial [Longimicrobiales bacterium]|nr:tetratricopeptide repeat protein [Longimicrobiales bacterium]